MSPLLAPGSSAPIFVVGGRSGTSLVRAMLNAHPSIHLAQESLFHLWTYPVFRRRDPARRLEAWLSSPSFAWLRVDPAEIRERFPEPLSEGGLAEAHVWTLRRVAACHGKRRWGDKSPVDVLFLNKVYAARPDARVILVTRDPRGTLLSLTSTPFASGSRTLGLLTGRGSRRRLDRWRDRIHTLRLEDLKRDPEGAMREALRFVGEPWDAAVLEHEKRIPADEPPYPWTRAAAGPLRRSPPRWPDELEPEWIRLAERAFRERMERHGYQRAELAEEPTAWGCVRAVLADLPEAFRYAGRVARLGRAFSGWGPLDPARVFRLALKLNPEAWEARPGWEMPALRPPPADAPAELRGSRQEPGTGGPNVTPG